MEDDFENEGGWPGDGSGMDDLADYNQLEADDYRNEGGSEEDCDPGDDGREDFGWGGDSDWLGE